MLESRPLTVKVSQAFYHYPVPCAGPSLPSRRSCGRWQTWAQSLVKCYRCPDPQAGARSLRAPTPTLPRPRSLPSHPRPYPAPPLSPQVGNLGLLFMLLFFIYAALGVELFGKLGE